MQSRSKLQLYTSSALQAAVLSLLVVVPIASGSFTQNPVRIKDIIIGIMGSLTVTLSLLRWIDLKWFRMGDTKTELYLVLFLLANIFSLFLNPTQWNGGDYLFHLVILLVFFKVFFALARGVSYEFFSRLIGLAAFITMIVGIVQSLGGALKPTSTFGNPNYFGGYLICVWPILVLLLRDPLKIFRGLALLDIALFLISLSLIRSWAMGLAFIASGFFLIFLYVQKSSKRFLILLMYGFSIILVIKIFALEKSFIIQVSEDIRAYIWPGVLNLIKEYPWLGCGAGQFLIFYPKFRIPEYFLHPLGVDNTDFAHCELLEILAETGLVGFILFVLFLIQITRYILKKASHLDSKKQLAVYSIMLGCGLLLFENLFDINLRYMASKFIFWSLLGCAYGMTCTLQTQDNQREVERCWVFWRYLGVIIVGIIFYYGYFTPFLGDYYFRRGVVERKQGNFMGAISFYEKSLHVWPKNIEGYYRLAYLYASLGKDELAAENYEKVVQLAPLFASVHGNLGTVYSRMNKLQKAYDHLSLQVSLNPYDADRICSLASVLLRMNQIDRAKVYLRNALVLNPKHEFASRILKELNLDNKKASF